MVADKVFCPIANDLSAIKENLPSSPVGNPFVPPFGPVSIGNLDAQLVEMHKDPTFVLSSSDEVANFVVLSEHTLSNENSEPNIDVLPLNRVINKTSMPKPEFVVFPLKVFPIVQEDINLPSLFAPPRRGRTPKNCTTQMEIDAGIQ